jgi:hypothetical protein
MPDKIVITGVPPYDGEYEFDGTYMTNRELHVIKKLTGLRVGEFQEALANADTDVILGIAVVALTRHGKDVHEDTLWDAEAGAITYVAEEEPASPPAEDQKQPEQPADDAEPSGSRLSSGDDSSEFSGRPANGQSPTGQPESDTTATSALLTSVS